MCAIEVGNVHPSSAKIITEPQDAEILHFVHHDAWALLERSAGIVATDEVATRKVNPKRLSRLVAKERNRRGISSRAQQAIQADLEARKKEKKQNARERKKALAERKREMKIYKAKARHRGR
ncbi:YjdF family protein [Polycladomyces sp. WAk]|uniref:YjdF family protein n=1 Tax=Polycladomyces zharkentensis TaxID=2807616 RepID=A0ABS2WM48_9BACL|nr:YjdF family protein [Polycladomyces sp. WAk]